VTLPDHIPVPGERFNFAQHLLQLNSAHPERAAFIDDFGVLSYGDLAERGAAWAPACARWACAARNACCC
jgi:hypothetical protein